MKNKILVSVLALILCLSVVLPLAACGNGGRNDDYDFTVLAVKEETVLDYNTMPVFKDLAEQTGKSVYWTYKTGAQYSNTSNPVNTKDYDAIYHAGFSNLDLYDYGRKNRIVAIDEYLDHMPNFKKILEDRPDIEQALQSPDGHIYSLPRVEEMGLKAYPNILFIRKSWLKKLIDDRQLPTGVHLTERQLVDGLELKRDEFKAILQKFNDLDMNGNGSTTDEVPLNFVYNNWQGNISDLIASFGVPENVEHKTIVNDKITFTVEDEKWFNAIVELNDWYNSKLIRTIAFTQEQDEFLAKGQNGDYGAFYWWEKETVVKKELHDDYIIVKPLADSDGKRYVGMSNELEVEKGECVILSTCKDIEGLCEYFDAFFEPDYSAQLNYGSISSGAFLAEKQNGKLIPNDDHGNLSADEFRMKNAPYGIVYLTAEVWENSVEMESRAKLRLDRLNQFVIPYTIANVKSIPNLNYTKAELDTLVTYESFLGSNISLWMTQNIRAATPPTKAQWQSFLNTNKDALTKIKETNQAAYDRYLAAAK